MAYLAKLFQGRIGRREYLYGIVLFFLIFAVTGWLVMQMKLSVNWSGLFLVHAALIGLYYVFFISFQVRRLHDIGASGVWWLLMFIPFVVFGMVVYLSIKKGDTAANQYGVFRRDVSIFNHLFLLNTWAD